MPSCLGIGGHTGGSRQGHPRYTSAHTVGRLWVARPQTHEHMAPGHATDTNDPKTNTRSYKHGFDDPCALLLLFFFLPSFPLFFFLFSSLFSSFFFFCFSVFLLFFLFFYILFLLPFSPPFFSSLFFLLFFLFFFFLPFFLLPCFLLFFKKICFFPFYLFFSFFFCFHPILALFFAPFFSFVFPLFSPFFFFFLVSFFNLFCSPFFSPFFFHSLSFVSPSHPFLLFLRAIVRLLRHTRTHIKPFWLKRLSSNCVFFCVFASRAIYVWSAKDGASWKFRMGGSNSFTDPAQSPSSGLVCRRLHLSQRRQGFLSNRSRTHPLRRRQVRARSPIHQ